MSLFILLILRGMSAFIFFSYHRFNFVSLQAGKVTHSLTNLPLDYKYLSWVTFLKTKRSWRAHILGHIASVGIKFLFGYMVGVTAY